MMKIYTIYDKVAQESGPLLLFKNDEAASRMFVNTLEKEMKNGCKPNDYELHCLGKFDPEKSVIYTEDLKVNSDGTKEFPSLNYIVAVKLGGEDE